MYPIKLKQQTQLTTTRPNFIIKNKKIDQIKLKCPDLMTKNNFKQKV